MKLKQKVSSHWIMPITLAYGIFTLIFVLYTNIPDYTYTPIVDTHEPADLWEASMLASEKWGVPYELLLGIANAESSMGTKFYGCGFSYNAWGVKPHNPYTQEDCNKHLAAYPDYLTGADDVARILSTYYLSYGLDTPEKIVNKYVGHYSESWINNVKYY